MNQTVRTCVKVADNSGPLIVRCFKVYGNHTKEVKVGSFFLGSVKSLRSKSNVKKGELVYGLLIRAKKYLYRKDRVRVSFENNECVLFNSRKTKRLAGTRVKGVLPSEIKNVKVFKLMALAHGIV